jgi:hypothetical protein
MTVTIINNSSAETDHRDSHFCGVSSSLQEHSRVVLQIRPLWLRGTFIITMLVDAMIRDNLIAVKCTIYKCPLRAVRYFHSPEATCKIIARFLIPS